MAPLADDLTDDEKELVRKHREERKAQQDAADGEARVWIKGPGGEEADIPYGKGKAWLQRTFGIDLDEEPVQDAEGQAPPDPKPAPSGRVAFGRRVS